MDLYWVGVDQNWHLATNWSQTSGGPGDGQIPTAADNVFFDGKGYILCWPTADVVCNDLTLLIGTTEMVIFGCLVAVINGDFSIAAGSFSPTGGPDHTIEFKGNYLNTGGNFSVGTGTGKDPECIFSGIDKTYQLNSLSAASFQHVLVSGTLTVSGTRLGQMNISQKLGITGVLELNANGLTICDIDLAGVNAGFGVFTGILKGTGRFWWRFREGHVIPATGTIEIKYFRLIGEPGQVSGSIDENLYVEGWNNIHNDWTHHGIEPWLDDDDGDTNYITLPADAAVGSYDEEYSIENIDSDSWTSISMTKVKVHLKGRLYDGTGGHALIIIRAYLWDGSIWQDAGVALFTNTTYADRTCSINLNAVFNTVSKLNGMKLKLEMDTIIGGGADKGGVNITQAWAELEGIAYWNPIFEIAPRIWTTPCEVELVYEDNLQTFRFIGGIQHYFGNKLTIHCDEVGVDEALLDWDTYTAQIYVHSIFNIYKDAFPSAIFTIKFGDGTHVFRGTVDFSFSYSSGVASQLIVDPGEGTLILWPRGKELVPIPPP